MKKFWITFGAIAFALILGTGIILLCCLPKAAPYNDKNDPAIEIPVDPETPPELPDDNPTDKEEDENPADDIPPETPKEDEDPKEDVIVGTVVPLSFNDGAIIGYNGTNNEITIPTSYSFGGYTTEETTFENIWDFYEWYRNQQFEWKGKEITIQLANGEDYVISNSSNILPELENIDDAFPIIYKERKEVFVEGNDFQVTSIADRAFENATIKKVVVPEGITHLGNMAFYNSTLKEIQLPESLMSIGNSCFSGTQLEHINLPANIKTISIGCFDRCERLIDIDLSNIERIEDSAFWGCIGLKEVTFSDNLQYIAYASFFVTESLEVMDIPSSLTEYTTFWNCYDGLKKLILRPNFVFDLSYDYSQLSSHLAGIYVPDDLLEQYKEQYPELNILAISEL